MVMVSNDKIIHNQVLTALQELSSRCNGATSTDSVGFNKYDAGNGKTWAMQNELTPEQVLRGAKMLQKYHAQIEVPSVRAAQRYFAIYGPRLDDSIIAVEDDDTKEESKFSLEAFEDEELDTPQVTSEPASTKTDIVLSAEQQALFNVMESTSQHLFITGRAGTGKSVLLRYFRENTKKRVVVAAPTGIAALNVRGSTIHSLFRLPPQFHRKGSLEPNSRVCSVLKRIDTLVIDEISMVRADLLDAIDERLREAHKNSLPFGGVQLVMFGDCYQLPPVIEEGLLPYFEKEYGGYFFFHAGVWQNTEFKIYELSQVFRQKDPTFKNVLNAVRDGTVTDEQITQLNERCGISIPAEGTLTLATTNNLVTQINQRRLNQLPGKTFEYKAFITGEMKRGTFPTEEIIQLKVGAQVVLLQNDKDKRWVNGTVATIAKLTKDEKSESITVHVNGIDYNLEKATWEEIRYEYDPIEGKVKEEVTSSFTQYPLRLAWAMTIHKSQGQTYESVAIDLTVGTFAPGQMYVALSRCTSLEGLYLKMPVKRAHIIVEPKVAAFMAKREAIVIEVSEETQTITETPVHTEGTPLAAFFEAAIQDAASRGFTVQAVVEAPTQRMPSEASESTETEPQETVKPVLSSLPTIDKGGRGKKKETVGVAYNFPVEVANKLKCVTELLNESGVKFDKSAWIASTIDPALDALIALLERKGE